MSSELSFQIIDWDFYHEDTGEDIEEFRVRLYGRTQEDQTVYLEVENFNPYFYVEIPRQWTHSQTEAFVQTLKNKVHKRSRDTLIDHERVSRYNMWKFNGEKRQPFLRLIFNNYWGFKAYEKVLKRRIFNRYLAKSAKKYKLYESNIEPMLRCMHTIGMDACGWITLPEDKCFAYKPKSAPSNCDLSFSIDYQNITVKPEKKILPFVIASFDIECVSKDGSFPRPEREEDRVIQIGTTFSRYGSPECFFKHIITLDSCDPIEGAEVESYNTEKEVLLAWTRLIQRMNPDILTGYNIFGFDYNYLYERSKKLGCESEFSKMCRLRGERSKFETKDLSSSALGENKLKYYTMKGRINIDLMKVIQRDHKLQSYKLDAVASTFIQEKVSEIKPRCHKKYGQILELETKGIDSIKVGQYLTINYHDGLSDSQYGEGTKFKIVKKKRKDGKEFLLVEGSLDDEFLGQMQGYSLHWCQAKDDVSPNDIFRFQKMGPKERAIIAKYCLQDCALCNRLMDKLQVLTNNIGMANVCHVPLSYLFLRGQGVKIFSLVSKKCRQLGYVIPVVRKKFVQPEEEKMNRLVNDNIFQSLNKWRDQYEDDEEEIEDEDGYEGATVFAPEVGVHYEPIPVWDYASLYPRSMMHRNISHEMLVEEQNYEKYRRMPGYVFNKVVYHNANGTDTVCYYAQNKNGKMGILPLILKELLDARSATKKEMAAATDSFTKSILDGLQLAYKITANSLYGQTGAPTSPIFLKHIAASTTATGRQMLTYAKRFMERIFSTLTTQVSKNKPKKFRKLMKKLFQLEVVDIEEGIPFFKNDHTKETVQELINDIFPIKRINPKLFNDKKGRYHNEDEFIDWYWDQLRPLLKGRTIKPRVIYGDTDSIFASLDLRNKKTGELLQGLEARKAAIDIAVLGGDLIHFLLPPPHDLEYEKTFDPFCILTKKRYVGNLYEFDPNKYKQKSMGIVLKRRDNAQVVKIVVGGIVQKILNEKSAEAAVKFTQQALKDILAKQYPMSKFIITKTLRSTYKDRTKMPHVVLADRMGDRDPGNKPQSNERIPFAYVETKHLKCSLCDEPADIGRCKCRSCMGMFCIFHLHNHRAECRPLCRLTRERDPRKLKRCLTCRGYYSTEKNEEGESPLELHKKRVDKETEEVFYDRCKKALPESILQGDIVEHPEFIVKNNWKLDYLFYITNQIMKPSLQFLELIAYQPERIFENYIHREMNRRKGKKPIRYYFGQYDSDVEDEALINKLDQDFGQHQRPESKPKRTIRRKRKEVQRKDLQLDDHGFIQLGL